MFKFNYISNKGVIPMEKFSSIQEVFLSIIKYFLVFIILNNLLWFGIFGYYVKKSYNSELTQITQEQSGTNNKQELLNEANTDR